MYLTRKYGTSIYMILDLKASNLMVHRFTLYMIGRTVGQGFIAQGNKQC